MQRLGAKTERELRGIPTMTMLVFCLAGLGALAVISYVKPSMGRLQTQRVERRDQRAARRHGR